MIFKKKKKSKVLSLSDVSNRTRALILDSQINDGHEISYLLGCSKISDELMEMEEDQSNIRVERISHLIPLIFAYAKLMAEGVTSLHKSNLPEEMANLPDELWANSRAMMEEFAFAVLVGSVSQLIDLELIKIPKGKK